MKKGPVPFFTWFDFWGGNVYIRDSACDETDSFVLMMVLDVALG